MMLDDMLILQHIKTSEFRICLKELFADQHDPVNVSYTVLAGVLVNDKNKLSLRRPSHAQQAFGRCQVNLETPCFISPLSNHQ